MFIVHTHAGGSETTSAAKNALYSALVFLSSEGATWHRPIPQLSIGQPKSVPNS